MILFFISINIAQDGGYIDSSKVRNPKIAWKLSIVPGLGQLYNGKVIKGTIFIGLEYLAIKEYLKYKDANSVGKRNTYAWWIFSLHLWNIVDAYVDAQMSTFPMKRLESNYTSDSLKVKEY